MDWIADRSSSVAAFGDLGGLWSIAARMVHIGQFVDKEV
jgi:hypothetical protein